jgi:sulfatase modifying factor 1
MPMKFRSILQYCFPPVVFLAAAAGAMVSCTANEDLPPTDVPEGMVWIASGPEQSGFLMDATEVTVADFAAFINETSYVTEADDFGWSGVFSKDSLGWLPVDGANWQYPLGPDSLAAQPNHPVTQISYRDVEAYADWADKRVPSEEEWIWAASQSGKEANFPWGKDMVPNGKYPGNWWQGPFPYEDSVLDGYPGVAPVKSYLPAPNGLYDISGNVWEWTSSTRSRTAEYIIKGGSFLCSTSYCTGFNLNTDQFTPSDSGLNHLGMRLIR